MEEYIGLLRNKINKLSEAKIAFEKKSIYRSKEDSLLIENIDTIIGRIRIILDQNISFERITIVQFIESIDFCLNLIESITGSYSSQGLNQVYVSNLSVAINNFVNWFNTIITNDKLNKELHALKEKSRNDSEEINILKSRLETELRTFEDRYKSINLQKELIKQEEIFNNAVREDNKKLLVWSIVGGCWILFAVFFYICYFKTNCISLDCYADKLGNPKGEINKTVLYFEFVKAIAFRAFLVSVFFLIATFILKTIKALLHNITINRHRTNSFAAGLALLEVKLPDSSKEKILLKAVDAIFSHHKTGYLYKDSTGNPNQVVENIIKDKINS